MTTRVYRVDLLLWGLLLSALLMLIAGCDFLRALRPDAPKIAACAVEEGDALYDAIQAPKDVGSWVNLALTTLECVPQVIERFENAANSATVASNAPSPAVLPPHVRARINVLKQLCKWKQR